MRADSLQEIIIEGILSGQNTPEDIRENVDIALERVEQYQEEEEIELQQPRRS